MSLPCMLCPSNMLQCGGVNGHRRNELATQLLMTSCQVHYGRAAGSQEPQCSAVIGSTFRAGCAVLWG